MLHSLAQQRWRGTCSQKAPGSRLGVRARGCLPVLGRAGRDGILGGGGERVPQLCACEVLGWAVLCWT